MTILQNGSNDIPLETGILGDVAVPVYVQDQKTRSLSLPFLNERTVATLAADTVIGDSTITLVTGHSVVEGNVVELTNTDTGNFMQAVVLSVATDVLTLDSPVTCVVDAAEEVVASSKDMNVDGSTTAVVFSITPLPSQTGDITRVLFKILDEVSMDGSTFGGIDELTNGCLLRVKYSDGCFHNIFNFKNNGDVKMECFDTIYSDANKKGFYTFSARLTWAGQNKHGVVIPLDGSIYEELQLVIQDDLTELDTFQMKAQGHVPN